MPDLCLRHAAHVAQHHVGSVPFQGGGKISHFSHRFLLCLIADATGVQEHDIGLMFRRHHGVALGTQLRCHGFGVALVHLAPVSFDIHVGHALTFRNLNSGPKGLGPKAEKLGQKGPEEKIQSLPLFDSLSTIGDEMKRRRQ